MTRPRSDSSREIFGILGRDPRAAELERAWNAFFREQGMDAVLSRYPATQATLPERLSEMFHFDRRGYIVGLPLQKAIIPLLDAIDPAAEGEGRVDTVVNRGGVFTGYFQDGRWKMEVWR